MPRQRRRSSPALTKRTGGEDPVTAPPRPRPGLTSAREITASPEVERGLRRGGAKEQVMSGPKPPWAAGPESQYGWRPGAPWATRAIYAHEVTLMNRSLLLLCAAALALSVGACSHDQSSNPGGTPSSEQSSPSTPPSNEQAPPPANAPSSQPGGAPEQNPPPPPPSTNPNPNGPPPANPPPNQNGNPPPL